MINQQIKEKAVILISLVGIAFSLFYYVFNGYYFDDFTRAGVDLIVFSMLSANLLFFYFSRNVVVASFVGMASIIIFIYFIRNYTGLSSYLWIYPMPWIAFFLLGFRLGLLASVLFGVGVFFLLETHPNEAFFQGRMVGMDVLASLALMTVLLALYEFMNSIYQRELLRLSQTDPLTGIYNRLMFEEFVEQEIERKRYHRPLSLMMIDLDHFKKINDTHGHLIGDRILTEFAKLIQNNIRTADKFARWGGEEFTLLLPETPLHRAGAMGEKLVKLVRESPFHEGLNMTTSIGVAGLEEDDNMDSLLRKADTALYQAKNRGRDQVFQYDDDRTEVSA